MAVVVTVAVGVTLAPVGMMFHCTRSAVGVVLYQSFGLLVRSCISPVRQCLGHHASQVKVQPACARCGH